METEVDHAEQTEMHFRNKLIVSLEKHSNLDVSSAVFFDKVHLFSRSIIPHHQYSTRKISGTLLVMQIFLCKSKQRVFFPLFAAEQSPIKVDFVGKEVKSNTKQQSITELLFVRFFSGFFWFCPVFSGLVWSCPFFCGLVHFMFSLVMFSCPALQCLLLGTNEGLFIHTGGECSQLIPVEGCSKTAVLRLAVFPASGELLAIIGPNLKLMKADLHLLKLWNPAEPPPLAFRPFADVKNCHLFEISGDYLAVATHTEVVVFAFRKSLRRYDQIQVRSNRRE